ncbi:MAG TPA: FtsQ-type POTRA domain-containing protein [Anaerolineales bacterium]|jgi:cell division septal protein FtsQ|nr:FtsQ-type POTRA domain-containing protein [Anaerolineales bacterium]
MNMMESRSHADAVRERRQREQTKRFNSTSGAVRGPLVSKPRRVENAGPYRPIRPRNEGGLKLTLPPINLDTLMSWRTLSIGIVILLVGILAWAMTDSRMYVQGINLGGASLVPQDEIYAQSGLANVHAFWIDPDEAVANIEAIPGIQDATVTVQWPATINVVVVERVPQLLLTDGTRSWWIDATGTRYASRGELPGLLPVVNDGQQEITVLPVEAVQGALQLRELRPNIEQLYFDLQRGLSYQDGRGWRGYFGTGTDMAQKLAVYERLVTDLQENGITPKLIDVTKPLAPYYR